MGTLQEEYEQQEKQCKNKSKQESEQVEEKRMLSFETLESLIEADELFPLAPISHRIPANA